MPTILIIDDETDFRLEMTSLLQKMGYHTISAASGVKGMELAREAKPEIAIIDLILPGAMNGYSVISKISAELPETIIFAITAYYNSNLETRVSNAGANRFYKKPLDIAKIKADIADIIGMPEILDIPPAPPQPKVVDKRVPKPKILQIIHPDTQPIKLFKFLDKNDFKKLLKMGRAISLAEGSVYKTTIPQNIVMVHSGSVHMLFNDQIKARRSAGTVFGEAFILSKCTTNMGVAIEAEKESRITVIEAVHIRNFFKLNPRYTSVFLLELSKAVSQELLIYYKDMFNEEKVQL